MCFNFSASVSILDEILELYYVSTGSCLSAKTEPRNKRRPDPGLRIEEASQKCRDFGG